MIRSLLQSALCLFLCPILVAQQIPTSSVSSDVMHDPAPDLMADTPRSVPEFVSIPKDTVIKLVLLDPVSSATASVGTVIRFAVAKDVVVRDAEATRVTAIHTGALVTGTIIKVKRGSYKKHRRGQLKVRLNEFETGNGIKLRLTETAPENRLPRGARIRQGVEYLGLVAICLPLWIYLRIAFHDSDRASGYTGDDVALSRCFQKTVYVVTDQKVHTAKLTKPNEESAPHVEAACSAGESSDWKSGNAEIE